VTLDGGCRWVTYELCIKLINWTELNTAARSEKNGRRQKQFYQLRASNIGIFSGAFSADKNSADNSIGYRQRRLRRSALGSIERPDEGETEWKAMNFCREMSISFYLFAAAHRWTYYIRHAWLRKICCKMKIHRKVSDRKSICWPSGVAADERVVLEPLDFRDSDVGWRHHRAVQSTGGSRRHHSVRRFHKKPQGTERRRTCTFKHIDKQVR